eukprot:7984245-Pyramimonas_sp.AAC.1
MFSRLRSHASERALPPLTSDEVSQAIRDMKGQVGQKLDRLCPADLGRLPSEATEELTTILNAIEQR